MRSWLRTFFLLACLLAAGAASAQTAPIPLVTSDWPPWVDSRQADGGPFPKLMRLVGTRMGVTFAFEYKPWKRAELDLREGNGFGAFPYRPSAERNTEFWFSDPIVRAAMLLFFVRGGSIAGAKISRIADLKPYRVGGVLGSWYQPAMEAAGIQVDWVPSLDASFQMLKLGRVDVVAAETAVGWAAARTAFRDTTVLETQGISDPDSGYWLMVSRTFPGSRELLERFNRALAVVRQTAEWRAVLAEVQSPP